MAKKMKAIDVINSAKQEFASRKVILIANNNIEYEVLIQEKLNESKLAELVSELTTRSEDFNRLNLEFDIILNIYVLIIKYFTDIKFNNYKVLTKQIEHETDLFKSLIDLNLLDQILNSFDEDCIKGIEKLFDKYPKQMSQVAENIAMEEVVDNADV